MLDRFKENGIVIPRSSSALEENKMQSPIVRGDNNSYSKSKSVIDLNNQDEDEEEEEEEEKEQGVSDDISDAISRLIDEEDEVSVDLSQSQVNNVSNNMRHGIMSKIN